MKQANESLEKFCIYPQNPRIYAETPSSNINLRNKGSKTPESIEKPKVKSVGLPDTKSKAIKKKYSGFSFKKDYRSRGKKFACEFCRKKFTKAQALGGHMSKSHPGMSHEFEKKVEKRKEREPMRELLKNAKLIY